MIRKKSGSMNNILYVFLGGGIGSVLRYFVSLFVKNKYEGIFPIATLISNVLSCIILGLAVGLFSQKMDEAPSLKFFILVGICGGFSTFSTYSYETMELIRDGQTTYAVINVFLSSLICIGILYFLHKSNTSF